jgi:GLPGLI family protein
MKTIYFFLLISSFAFGQETQNCDFKARYHFTYLNDTVEMKYKTEEYSLVRTNKEIQFFNFNSEYNDSIYVKAGHITSSNNMEDQERWLKDWNSGKFWNIIKRGITDLIYFHDLKSKKQFVRYRDISLPMYYSLSIPEINWEITNERDTINNVMVIKAHTLYGGRNYIAWFAPSIPINEGPYVFRSLPGLIFSVQDEEKNYRFDLQWYKSEVKNCWLNNGVDGVHKEIKYEEWVKIRREIYYNPRFPFDKTKEDRDRTKRNKLAYRHLLLEK